MRITVRSVICYQLVMTLRELNFNQAITFWSLFLLIKLKISLKEFFAYSVMCCGIWYRTDSIDVLLQLPFHNYCCFSNIFGFIGIALLDCSFAFLLTPVSYKH